MGTLKKPLTDEAGTAFWRNSIAWLSRAFRRLQHSDLPMRPGTARPETLEFETEATTNLWRKRGVNDRPRFASPFHGFSAGGIETVKEIGNYFLLDTIGSGSFGTVFLAEHKHLQDRVALKLLHFEGASETLVALTRAARYLSALDHPNIVHLRDFGATEEYAYLVMDLITPGVAIDLMAARMPFKATVEILVQVADALEYSHNAEFLEGGVTHKGIYHGDIKPANVLMGSDRAYLTDFMLPNMQEFQRRDHGHSCFPYDDTRWYGTPMYMAPEQLRGVVNNQTDIFAFGVTSYELLTGKYPWNTEEEFLARFGETPEVPPSVSAHNRTVPEALSDLIQHCLSFHPGDRPTSFSEVARTLRSVLTQLDASQIKDRGLAVSRTYDVALSFAGTERTLAEEIYRKLRHHCRVFYDRDPQTRVDLWGSDLSTHLHEVYANQAAYCLVLISNEYVERAWTNWERRAILQRMVNSKTGEYILPVLIDDVVLPGLPTTVGMLTIREAGIDGIVDAVRRKVQGSAASQQLRQISKP